MEIFAYDYFESAATLLLTGMKQEPHFSLWFSCKPLCTPALTLYISIYMFAYMQVYLKMDIGTSALWLIQGKKNSYPWPINQQKAYINVFHQ